MRFGVSQFTTTPWTFEEDLRNYVGLGVETIEVCEFKLDEDRAEEQLAAVGEYGMEISSFQPSVRTLFPSRTQPKPEALPERLAAFRRAIERVGPFARGVPFVCNTGPPPAGNVGEVYEVAKREYGALSDFAAERGALVALEPLNPALMNVETAIWTLEQTMQIVEAVDRQNFGVCLDFWNVWQERDVAGRIAACDERIMVVQASDWRTPRSFADRLAVGGGEIPLAGLIRAVHEAGYRGAYTLEIFSDDVPDSLWEGDLRAVITESREGLKGAWEEVVGPLG